MVIRKMEGTLDKVVAYGQPERKPKRFNVTDTQAYREVYTNNLRMYSFLMKKELDRKKQQNLRNRKEEYFQKHLSLENNQRSNRLLKSFRQMSRMRTCLSDLDLSRTSESDWENSKEESSLQVKVSGLQLDLNQSELSSRGDSVKGDSFKGDSVKGDIVKGRPRSWTAIDHTTPKSPQSFYHQVRRSSAFAVSTTSGHSKYLSVPSLGRLPSPLTSPDSRSSQAPVLLVSPTRQTYVPSLVRHVSDIGVQRSRDIDLNNAYDSDTTNSDNEIHSEDGSKDDETGGRNSPGMQRARQAKRRQDYRKARIASLEHEILKADTILRDLKRRSRELHESIPEDS